MRTSRIYNIIIFGLIPLFITTCEIYAYDDGFGQARKIESEHFTIFYAPKLDEAELIQNLNITQTDRVLAGVDTKQGSLSGLAEMLDILFLRVCDTLDMQLFSFKGNIKICKDYDHLNQVYKSIFDKDLGGMVSFYIYSFNTVYISADSFKREVLGHEIAHAVISHYFVVQPTMKIQEVLAGYVEYQLRKTTK